MKALGSGGWNMIGLFLESANKLAVSMMAFLSFEPCTRASVSVPT